MKKYLTLTNELQVADQTIKRDYRFVVDVSDELFEDCNSLVFNKNPDALYKCRFEDYVEGSKVVVIDVSKLSLSNIEDVLNII